jgi:ABC-2 type transport system ATP-binding protein
MTMTPTALVTEHRATATEQLAVRTVGLTKWYGSTCGIDELELEVHRGEVLGLLGPNGAGKTTTLRLLVDLIRPTRGRAEVFGLDARTHSIEVRRRIGYLPGDLTLPRRLTGRDFVSHLADLRGGVAPRAADELAERLGLDLDRRISELSKGNRQKLGVVQAFQHRPDLYLLDEPTSGLDPLVQHSFHQLIDEVVSAGATVLLSSHVLAEVQHLARRVAVIRAGRLAAIEDVEQLHRRAVRHLHVRFADVPSASELGEVPGVDDVSLDGPTMTCVLVGEADPLIKALARHRVISITSEEPDLEELFLRLYESNDRDD